MKPPDRQWSVNYVRRTTTVWSSEAACACRPAIWHYSKWSSTRFVRLAQARRLPSIHGRTIAPMLPPEGWRLEAELYSSERDQLSVESQLSSRHEDAMPPETTGLHVNPSDETIRLGPLAVRFLLTGDDSTGSVAVFVLA